MQINIPDQELANLFSAQILASLTPEAREKVIKAGIDYILSPGKTGGMYPKDTSTPLEIAFKNGLERLADRVVAEYIENDPEIKQLILDNMPKVGHFDYDKKLIVTQAFAEALLKIVNEERDNGSGY